MNLERMLNTTRFLERHLRFPIVHPPYIAAVYGRFTAVIYTAPTTSSSSPIVHAWHVDIHPTLRLTCISHKTCFKDRREVRQTVSQLVNQTVTSIWLTREHKHHAFSEMHYEDLEWYLGGPEMQRSPIFHGGATDFDAAIMF